MKIRLCPTCGKQNAENVWNCVDCGTTLSMKTIIDTSQSNDSKNVRTEKGVLDGISPYFQDDLTAILKTLDVGEEITKGSDICQGSILPPYKFGYIVITSKNLILVQFVSEIDKPLLLLGRATPKRPWLRRALGSFVEGNAAKLPFGFASAFHFVNRPGYALTSIEKSSRQVLRLSLQNLYSVTLAEDVFLKIKYTRNEDIALQELAVTFYFNNEAFEIHTILSAHLKKLTTY